MKASGKNSTLRSDDEVRAELEAWLRPMREVTPEPVADAVLQQRRAETVNSISAAIRRAPQVAARHRGVQKFWWAAAAAAVLAVGGAGYTLNQAPTVEVAQAEQASLRQVVGKVVVTLPNGDDRMVTSDTQLGTGDEVSTTAQAFASLELEDQARLDLSSATTVKLDRVVKRDNGFFLRSGRVDVNVPKVAGETRRLTVRTADTLVSVRGTIFSVEVSERDEQSVTSVGVTRGSVAVSFGGKEIVLRSGQRWSSLDFATGTNRKTPGATDSDKDDSAITESPATPSGAGAARASATSSLGRQNWLFEQGLHARDLGNHRKAKYWFERLLKEFPSSPLIPSARTERDKAKRQLSN